MPLGDGAYGPGLTAGGMVSGPSLMLLQVRCPHVPTRTGCLGMASMDPDPPRGVRCHHVWEPDPLGAYAPGPASGARTFLPP
jgi:hypothetical protein